MGISKQVKKDMEIKHVTKSMNKKLYSTQECQGQSLLGETAQQTKSCIENSEV